MNRLGQRDERELAVDRAADRLAYIFLSYGILLAVAWRSFVGGESAWDLLALVIAAGLVGAVYRFRTGVLTRSWLLVAGLTAAVSLVIAVVVLATRT